LILNGFKIEKIGNINQSINATTGTGFKN
jgi:hypothetical protein